MKTTEATLRKIEEFEGCVLHAYKPVAAEQFYTIGYGHHGADVSKDMTITKEQAHEFFKQDISRFENYVMVTGLELTQNQFDALVSFTYNCGPGNLQRLIKNRSLAQIGDAILLYNKGANGKTLEGLVRRRQWEHDLFMAGTERGNGNPYSKPKKNVRMNSRGNDVRWVQYALNQRGGYGLIVDGIAGEKTVAAIRDFQSRNGLDVDGIAGVATFAKLEG